MAIRKKENKGKPEIDLTGPDGNAFFLIGYARQISKQLGIDPNPIVEEMQSGDYEHLIKTFDHNFGHLVDLVR